MCEHLNKRDRNSREPCVRSSNLGRHIAGWIKQMKTVSLPSIKKTLNLKFDFYFVTWKVEARKDDKYIMALKDSAYFINLHISNFISCLSIHLSFIMSLKENVAFLTYMRCVWNFFFLLLFDSSICSDVNKIFFIAILVVGLPFLQLCCKLMWQELQQLTRRLQSLLLVWWGDALGLDCDSFYLLSVTNLTLLHPKSCKTFKNPKFLGATHIPTPSPIKILSLSCKSSRKNLFKYQKFW